MITRRPHRLTHISSSGSARMVDVGAKPIAERVAIAEGSVSTSPALARAIRANSLKKGNLLEVARLAGIQAAKRTDELIPLCHTLPLDSVDVQCTLKPGRVHIRAEVHVQARTGVEMEAFTAVAIAALTVVDMGKAIDKTMTITGIRLLEKRGGRSGHFIAPAARKRKSER